MSYNLIIESTFGALANGDATNIATATLTWNGAPVEQSPLLFTLSGEARFDNALNTKSMLTDAQGKVQLAFTDSRAETIIISVFDTPRSLSNSTTSTFSEAHDSYNLNITSTSGARPNGKDKNKITVSLTDNSGAPLNHRIIDLTTDKHALFTDSSLSSTSVITGPDGSKEVYITDTEAERVYIKAVCLDNNGNTLADDATYSGFGQPVSPYILTLETENGAPADGMATNKITATLKNRADGSPAGHEIIDITAIGHALFQGTDLNSLSMVTREDGRVIVQLTNTVAEGVAVIAAFDYTDGTERALGTTHFEKVHHYTLAVEAENNALANNKSLNKISLSLQDEDDKPVPDAKIHIAVNNSATFDNGEEELYLTTDAHGTATAYIKDSVAEAVAIVATYKTASATTTSLFQKVEYSALVGVPESIDRKPGFYINIKGKVNNQLNVDTVVFKNIKLHSDKYLTINGSHDYSGAGNNGINNLLLPILGEYKGKANIDVHIEFVDGTTFSQSYTVAVS